MIDSKEERQRFAALIVQLSDYYKSETSRGVMALYWEGLRQYDFEAIEKAAWAHTQSPDEAGRWMPKISDLTKVLAGRTSDQGQIAWTKVDGAVRRVGPYQDVVFDDPVIHRVIQDMGGWSYLNGKDEKEWPFVSKEFVNRYQGYKMSGEVPDYAPVLLGLSNAHNEKVGYNQRFKPMLIGNEAQAQNVMAGGNANSAIGMRVLQDVIKKQLEQ